MKECRVEWSRCFAVFMMKFVDCSVVFLMAWWFSFFNLGFTFGYYGVTYWGVSMSPLILRWTGNLGLIFEFCIINKRWVEPSYCMLKCAGHRSNLDLCPMCDSGSSVLQHMGDYSRAGQTQACNLEQALDAQEQMYIQTVVTNKEPAYERFSLPWTPSSRPEEDTR